MGEESKTTMERVAAVWRYAAQDLGLDVVAPYQVVDRTSGESIDCVALVRGFGSAEGSILLDLRSATAAQAEAVSSLGFFVSRINTLAYSEYDRMAVKDTLNDWGWFGAQGQQPAWYSGQSWT